MLAILVAEQQKPSTKPQSLDTFLEYGRELATAYNFNDEVGALAIRQLPDLRYKIALRLIDGSFRSKATSSFQLLFRYIYSDDPCSHSYS